MVVSNVHLWTQQYIIILTVIRIAPFLTSVGTSRVVRKHGVAVNSGFSIYAVNGTCKRVLEC